MNHKKKYFKLFANCIPVKGAIRSVICDLQRNEYELIPNSMYELLTEYKNKDISLIKKDYGSENESVIDEYIAFLEEKEFGFWCDDPSQYPDMNLQWDSPSLISNAIITSSLESNHNYSDIFSQLHELGCRAVELRSFTTIKTDEIKEILSHTQGGRLEAVEIYMPYHESITEESLRDVFVENPRLAFVWIHSSPFFKEIKIENSSSVIFFIEQKIENDSHCGQVNPFYFSSHRDYVLESMSFNSCLNKKIAIDIDGTIKNCPSLKQTYGNIKSTPLHTAISHEEFTRLWDINKDQVEVCRDCEFRYICPDCRAFITQKDNIFSKPSKCTYDPYSATWKE